MDRNSPTTRRKKLPLRHVLIVEDDPVLGVALEYALEDFGVETVELCPTTDEALVALKRRTPDCIVIDIHLADRDDGWAVAELVRDLGPKPPKIVFSTGAPDEIPAEIAALGPVLVKPYDPQTLIELLRGPKRKGIVQRLRGALG